jgi:dienelactone hydrolase
VIGVPACGASTISFTDGGSPAVAGVVVPLTSREGFFKSNDVVLFGRLTLPDGSGPAPVIVEVHGAERDAATDYDFAQRLFPALGVGVFVYDKRGTGRSAGRYTQDFNVLANDVVAALAEAKRLAGHRVTRVGLRGGSQGGWVAPLAATRSPVDFVIVDFGLAGSPGDENRDQTVVELARKGYGSADLAAAADVADATNAIIASHFRSGFDTLDAMRGRYASRPWFKQIHGQFAGVILRYPDWVLRLVGPFLEVGTPINYDAMAVLRQVDVPMLWVLAGDDTYAPNTTTQARLRELARDGHPITALVFPLTDHGILEFITTSDGSRLETRNPDGYFRTTVDFALHERLSGTYGTAQPVLEAEADRSSMQ